MSPCNIWLFNGPPVSWERRIKLLRSLEQSAQIAAGGRLAKDVAQWFRADPLAGSSTDSYKPTLLFVHRSQWDKIDEDRMQFHPHWKYILYIVEFGGAGLSQRVESTIQDNGIPVLRLYSVFESSEQTISRVINEFKNAVQLIGDDEDKANLQTRVSGHYGNILARLRGALAEQQIPDEETEIVICLIALCQGRLTLLSRLNNQSRTGSESPAFEQNCHATHSEKLASGADSGKHVREVVTTKDLLLSALEYFGESTNWRTVIGPLKPSLPFVLGRMENGQRETIHKLLDFLFPVKSLNDDSAVVPDHLVAECLIALQSVLDEQNS